MSLSIREANATIVVNAVYRHGLTIWHAVMLIAHHTDLELDEAQLSIPDYQMYIHG